jgi:hypothetical protein
MTEAVTSSNSGAGDPSTRALAAIVAAFILIDAVGTWLWWANGDDVLAVLSYTLLTFQSVFGPRSAPAR